MGSTDEPAITLSPAQRFVRLCGRAFLATARSDELVEAARSLSPDQWHELFADATAQGMAPMVFQMSAKSGALAFAPETFAAMFRSSYTLALVNTRRIELQLAEMLRVFAEQRLDMLVLKGPPLVRRLYSDPALRPIGDLDLLARPGDLEHAMGALESLGYHAVLGYGSPTISMRCGDTRSSTSAATSRWWSCTGVRCQWPATSAPFFQTPSGAVHWPLRWETRTRVFWIQRTSCAIYASTTPPSIVAHA